jgi:hypothetical protein
MARQLDTTLAAALANNAIVPCFFLQITFASATRYVWTGVGNFTFNAMTFEGIGSLGKVGTITEGVEIKAEGTTVTLSGIDPVLQAESMTDIRLGAPATLWFGLMANATTLMGVPYKIFSGFVDRPTLTVSPTELTISLALESAMVNLQRPQGRRYTSADQRITHPSDTAFGWVEVLSDQALLWGSSGQ